MDPNEALKTCRTAAEQILKTVQTETAIGMAEHFIALDDWLCAGGFLPASWEKIG